jgi:hypothetical protein
VAKIFQMLDPTAIATEISAYSGALGISVTPTIVGAVKGWLGRDVRLNALAAVEDRLREERPAPGDLRSLRLVFRSLHLQLVDPGFRTFIDDLLIRGDASALERLSQYLLSHLQVPDAGNRNDIVDLIVDELRLNVGRAQRDPMAAIDLATAVNADRTTERIAALLSRDRRADASARRALLIRRAEPVLARHARFGGRGKQQEALDRFIRGDRWRYALVKGISGYGKTALLAHLVTALQRAGVPVAYHFISRADDLASEVSALRSLCAQLAVYAPFSDEPLSSDVHELRARLPQLLEIVSSEPRRIVVVLDGLDEAEHRPGAGGWPRADLFPVGIAANVRFVLSARTTRRDWLTDLGLRGRCCEIPDLETMGLDEVAAVMRAADVPALVERSRDMAWTRALHDVTAGDPFYVRFLVDDLCENPTLTVEQLRRRPRGLDAYLDGWWLELVSAGRGTLVGDALGYLLAAHGPLTREDLLEVGAGSTLTAYTVDDALTGLGRYLIGSDGGISLCHPRFVEYITHHRVPAAELGRSRDAFVSWIRRLSREDWRSAGSPYPLRHAAAHLSEAGDRDGVIQLPTPARALRQFQVLGDHRQFMRELDDAVAASRTDPVRLVDLCSTAMRAATRRTIAVRLPVEAVVALIRCGQLNTALAAASLASDEWTNPLAAAPVVSALLAGGHIEHAAQLARPALLAVVDGSVTWPDSNAQLEPLCDALVEVGTLDVLEDLLYVVRDARGGTDRGRSSRRGGHRSAT